MTTETLPAPVETVTPIKPSEAIRLGCLRAPVQIDGELFGPPGKACALGALALGLGIDPYGYIDETGVYEFVRRVLPETLSYPGDGNNNDDRALHVIAMLNDHDRWPRERIADWLEGLGL